jgi:hypothetical protein
MDFGGADRAGDRPLLGQELGRGLLGFGISRRSEDQEERQDGAARREAYGRSSGLMIVAVNVAVSLSSLPEDP